MIDDHLQHLLELLVCGLLARNLQLPLDLVLALLPVLHLDPVILSHHLHKPPEQTVNIRILLLLEFLSFDINIAPLLLDTPLRMY